MVTPVISNHAQITIEGVDDLELLSQSEMSSVYAARRTSDNRLVAIKILRPPYATDATFRSRFSRVCAMHQQMVHRNVVRALGYSADASVCYQVMEFLPAGTLNDRLQSGMSTQAIIKTVKDIARSLDHIHEFGLVHKDVKPENVMFRDDGIAVLIDFGIAELMEDMGEHSLTPKGTVLGTYEYMSPEQASGRAIDGRSDLFSLGVLFFQVLTGRVPYVGAVSGEPDSTAADAATVESSPTRRKADELALARHLKLLQEPTPRLPNHLLKFQDVIDRCLAKRPTERYQTGAELVEALDEVRMDDTLPEVTFKTQPVDTQEIRALAGEILATPRDPIRAERQNRRRRRTRRLRVSALLLVLAAVAGAGGYYAWDRDLLPLERILAQIGIGEDPQLIAAWSEAQSIRQDPNQGLAAIVAAYRRVLAIDPAHSQAQAEVAGLANEWKSSIDEALVENNLEQAETRLNEARTVFPDDAEWLRLDIALQNRSRAERLMVSTQALLTSHGLSDQPSAAAAVQSYQEVLRLAPGHQGALAALDEIAVHYTGLASQAAQRGAVNDAISLLERATSAKPNLPALDDVRQKISQATNTQAAIEALLQQARRYRAENQLIGPTGENAAELYHRVLATDPDNVIAAQGLDEITAQVTASANALLANGDIAAIDILVNQAAAAGLSVTDVNAIRTRLETERNRQSRIVDSLATARSLMALGYLTAPVDNNAVAKLREVQQADSGNDEARALLQQCAERLARVAREAYSYGLTAQAEQYLDLALTITPEVEAWVALRERWESQ